MRWVNEFVVPATTVVTLAGGTTEYVVKPLEVEQTMPEASGEASDCTWRRSFTWRSKSS